MKICHVTIAGVGAVPYSQSAQIYVPKLDREGPDAYDERTWRHHCTVDEAGLVVVPAMAIKFCANSAAQKLGIKVIGRKGATYKKYFLSGYFPNANAPLLVEGKRVTPAEAEMWIGSVNSNGQRGSGSRVIRRYPEFRRWQATFELTIVDDILTEKIFLDHLEAAGVIVGIGRFRPEVGGLNGRFAVLDIAYEQLDIEKFKLAA